MQGINKKSNEEMLNKIIAAAYKDAGLIDRLKVYFLTRKDPEVKRLFQEYRTTALSIKNIPLDKCPETIIESVKTQTGTEKIFIQKPALTFASVVIIAVITVSVLILNTNENKPAYSQAEIELAEEQVKTSFAIVNKVFRKTENLIQEDVLPNRVGKPIHKSLTIINNILTGG